MKLAVAAKGYIPEFREQLLAWFDANARDLPWRRKGGPYSIWVSEIMLQQTRVAAVLDHYANFMTLFPSIVSLALAREDEVLAAWSGLGYYRRAKLLHRAAQFVVREHQGSLPRTADDLRKMPGVGEYTAAAIASIAFGEPVAVIDGNVQRVIRRIFHPPNDLEAQNAPTAQWIRRHADALLDRERPGDFNQSMMELGATVCFPKNPLCLSCPVQKFCITRGEHAVEPRKPMRSRQIAYALMVRGGTAGRQILLEQRPESVSLMPGMWELPEITMAETDQNRVELTLRHSITVTNYYVRVLRLPQKLGRRRLAATASTRKWVKASELAHLPLTGLTRKILKRLQIMLVARVSV
ncbi:MAG TPA: A/G-specific adenine glycosylase [Acidobacteriaceae bacterium]|jgi:A/G-specific adenine glycosylase